MELSQKYVYTIWKQQSFSKAAKELFVSQPSLSATVAKLEGELGFKIFNRSTHPISITEKGRIYLGFLEEIHEAENQLHNQLAATDNMEQGSLIVGGNIGFVQFVFPSVCQVLIQKHPRISLTLDIDASEEKLKKQLIDLQFTFYPLEKEYTVIPVQEERLFVVIHKNHPAAKPLADYALSFEELVTGSIAPEHEITDFSIFSRVPFIKVGKRSDSDKRLSVILKDHLTAQCTIINAKTFDARYRMLQRELGAIFASDFFLKQFPQDQNDLYYFALRSPHCYRTTYIQYKRDSSNQTLLNEFVKAVMEYCNSHNIIYL